MNKFNMTRHDTTRRHSTTRDILTFDEAAGVEMGSGLSMDGNEAAGVEVWRLADERESDGFRWRAEGDAVRRPLFIASMPFLGCE